MLTAGVCTVYDPRTLQCNIVAADQAHTFETSTFSMNAKDRFIHARLDRWDGTQCASMAFVGVDISLIPTTKDKDLQFLAELPADSRRTLHNDEALMCIESVQESHRARKLSQASLHAHILPLHTDHLLHKFLFNMQCEGGSSHDAIRKQSKTISARPQKRKIEVLLSWAVDNYSGKDCI